MSKHKNKGPHEALEQQGSDPYETAEPSAPSESTVDALIKALTDHPTAADIEHAKSTIASLKPGVIEAMANVASAEAAFQSAVAAQDSAAFDIARILKALSKRGSPVKVDIGGTAYIALTPKGGGQTRLRREADRETI